MALSKKNPTSQKSWSSLKDLYNQESNLHINDYFNSEKNRLENFTASLNDLHIDFTKNRISKKAFNLLIELCKETDLKENIDNYFNFLHLLLQYFTFCQFNLHFFLHVKGLLQTGQVF